MVTTQGNGYLSVNYVGLIPVLVEAIKEQQATIESLQKDITAIKKKIGME